MEKSEAVIKIPYGTRDFLPLDARRKRDIEETLARRFSQWGYEEVVTPTMEYMETLTTGTGTDMSENMFKFFDRNNRILALRPDMTTPIARLAATRLQETLLPLRLFYLTNVFRYEEAQAGRQCEFYQAGVELLGAPGPAADAEVVALAIHAVLAAGLENFQIGLGQVGFINGLMEESGLKSKDRQQALACLVRRDLVGLEEVVNKSGLGRLTREALCRIPLLHGGEAILTAAYTMVDNSVSRTALDNLAEIYQLLRSYGLERYVTFDLGIIRDFEYYTGMVLEGYTPGLGFPLCGGGRYDNMVAAFGFDCPATGFAIGIERILLALDRQGIRQASPAKDIYIGWQEGALRSAIAIATQLRQAGQTVELAPIPESRQEAEQTRERRGYRMLQYAGE